MTEDEMIGWHHQHMDMGTLGAGDGQGGMASYCSWSRRIGHD